MSRVLLIGGPSDGQEVEGRTTAVLDIEGSRYVFLPLYEGALKARFARGSSVRTGS